MARTRLAECPACEVLVHQPLDEPYACPQCLGALHRGLVHVGFDDAARVYGEPGAPWRPPAEPALVEKMTAVWRCTDGHKARSREEWLIDEWLHANGIPHERESKLKGMRPDWRVGNIYVEYWGLMGAQGYEARREEKLALYRRRRLKLVELFPDDLEDLGAKLGGLPRKVGLDALPGRAPLEPRRRDDATSDGQARIVPAEGALTGARRASRP